MKINIFIKRHRRILAVEAILLILTIWAITALHSESNKLYIAVVLDQESSRITVKNALKIYAERINKYGGIQTKDTEGETEWKKLEFIWKYDEGIPEKAKEIAREVVNDKKYKFAAVIGHFNPETTAAAAKIYNNAKKTLLVPWSNIDINSQWIFQISPAPSDYGLYTAHYIRKILKKQSITIFHSEKKNDVDFVESFEEAFTKLGGRVEKKISVNDEEKEHINNVISDIEDKENNMLLLATQRKQTEQLIVALKEKDSNIKIMSMDNNLRTADFNTREDRESKYPGYFSDGIYAPSVLLFDNMKKELALVRKDYELKRKEDKSYQENQLTLPAMKAVLAAHFIKEALKDIPQKENGSLSFDEMTSFAKSCDWFSGQKVRSTKLVIGVYSRRNLIKAPINPFTVNAGDVPDELNKKLLWIDDRQLYPADVVYSGIAMNKISNIDMLELKYDLDFFVWFRYRYGVEDADDIEFLNSIQDGRLLDVVKETKRRKDEDVATPEGAMTASLVREEKFPEQNSRWGYSCYRVTGRFQTESRKNYALGQQNLFVKFRNYRHNKFKLNYVSDSLHHNKGIYSREVITDSNLEELKFNLIDAHQLELKYAYTYIFGSEKTMLGLPEGINSSNDFSEVIAEYRVEPVLLSFRGIVGRLNGILSNKTGDSEDEINLPVMILCFSISLALFLFSIYGDHTSASNKYATYWWLLKLSLILFMLLFGELVVSQFLYDIKNSPWGISHQSTIASIMYYWGKTVGISSWLIPAYYIVSAFDQFLWVPIERKTGSQPPAVLRLFVTVIIYTMGGLGILYYVLEIRTNSLVATSGAVAVLFAVASKIDLSNVLAGLGITFSKVFKLRDWVKIDGIEGKVIEMTPRSTKILTFDSSVVNIPNSKAAGAVIENFNRPGLPYRLMIHLETVPVYRFERVEKILLDAVASTQGVLDSPKAAVIFKGQGDSCQIYEVVFFIRDYSKRAVLWQATWRRIWRHLEQAGIELATPQREIFMPNGAEEDKSLPFSVLTNSGAFSSITSEARAQLAEKTEQCTYQAGEVIVKRGEDNERIFIIIEGVVSLTDPNGIEKRLGVADVFGMDDQFSDREAVALTNSEMLIVNKEDFCRMTEGG
ncbi:MAG: hypothetical protein D3911_05255 [Candidatus Electrothrix sp. AW3_4]|nr:hypothetical protein [Candidatus Electrothrix gigas]